MPALPDDLKPNGQVVAGQSDRHAHHRMPRQAERHRKSRLAVGLTTDHRALVIDWQRAVKFLRHHMFMCRTECNGQNSNIIGYQELLNLA
ncbi:MAG: hypothetical protein CSA50_07060 [Gammaproteobacteria bacterium]|nr:MAG: hypothetical protein CSA50_07060 [Gammaproteobacteria bacterium]